MDIKTYTTLDRTEWGSGPWDNEPDKVQWPDEPTGLPCLAVRGPFGSWCGYVGVAEGHPLYGQGYDAPSVDVHGGLTFADKCHPAHFEAQGICHVPGPGEPDHVWWFGFDCGHGMDIMPSRFMRNFPMSEAFCDVYYPEHRPTYKSLSYVQEQCAALAEQLANIE